MSSGQSLADEITRTQISVATVTSTKSKARYTAYILSSQKGEKKCSAPPRWVAAAHVRAALDSENVDTSDGKIAYSHTAIPVHIIVSF